ncbi:unnamed protein product [Discula destructiva]
MQFSTTFLALAAAMTASATPIFSVTNFTAACIPHSSQCSYDFQLYAPGQMGGDRPMHCSEMLISDGLGTLPPVTNGTCENSSRTWTITKLPAGGLEFEISQQVTPISFNTGSRNITTCELTIEVTGASSQQRYVGPAAFDLF